VRDGQWVARPQGKAAALTEHLLERRNRVCRTVGRMVRIEWFEGSRAALADLFALADDAPVRVRSYRDLGRVLVARDGPALIGHLQLTSGERAGEAEVKSIAVREDRQGAGVGRMLLNRAVAICRQENRSALLAATAAADTRVLRFYQLLGFRLLRVERDVFTPEAGYPEIDVDGVPLRDQVWLSIALQNPDRSRAQAPALQLRVARHTERLEALVRFYRDGLGLLEIGGFRGHDGYHGVFLEVPGTGTHLELTAGGGHGAPLPHPESLLVLYLGDAQAVQTVSTRLGVDPIPPANPYWGEHGTTFQDPDGFRVVFVPERWAP
jgi:GNAT superfamily N-acetyltransferase/catechol 2,3-dioxygenase-like lactoylglutathione lyase family enzyme